MVGSSLRLKLFDSNSFWDDVLRRITRRFDGIVSYLMYLFFNQLNGFTWNIPTSSLLWWWCWCSPIQCCIWWANCCSKKSQLSKWSSCSEWRRGDISALTIIGSRTWSVSTDGDSCISINRCCDSVFIIKAAKRKHILNSARPSSQLDTRFHYPDDHLYSPSRRHRPMLDLVQTTAQMMTAYA